MDAGFREAVCARQAIGYKEYVPVLEGNCSLEEATVQVKQATRRYAKRQRTWFRRDSRIEWIDATNLHRQVLTGDLTPARFTQQLLHRAVSLLGQEHKCVMGTSVGQWGRWDSGWDSGDGTICPTYSAEKQ
jgi:hypothetical protein